MLRMYHLIYRIVFAIFILQAFLFAGNHAFARSALDTEELDFLRYLEPDWVHTSRYHDMVDRLDDKGTVRVIIGLAPTGERSMFVPEGDLGDSGEIVSQRRDISRIQDELIERLSLHQIRQVKQFHTVPYLAMEVDVLAFSELLYSPEVASISEDTIHKPTLSDSIPIIGADDAWNDGYSGTGQVVAILDTGVDKNHPFLAGKVVSEACYSHNFTVTNPDTGEIIEENISLCPGQATSYVGSGAAAPCETDCEHGTHVAGIAAGLGGSFSGVAKSSDIIAIQVFTKIEDKVYDDTFLGAYTSDIIDALERVYDLRNTYDIAAVNLSLGGGQYESTCDAERAATKTAVDNLRSAGIATIAASGNDGWVDAMGGPACISTVISVGSTTKSDYVSAFSNVSSELDVFAPGSSINSSVPGGDYEAWNGTSMATPHVTGAWAVLKSAAPDASVSEILNALTSTGEPIRDTIYTRPRIQVDAAVNTFQTGPSEDPAEISSPSPGSTLSGTTVTFSWNDVGADMYALWIGASYGQNDIYAEWLTGVSTTVTGLPNDGSTIHVRMLSKFDGVWKSNFYTYTATTAPISDEPAVILSPDPGTQFGSTTVNFTWNDVGADIYALWIGASYGQNDIYAEWLTGVSTTVTGLPNDGSTIHVRMLSKFDGVWKSNFYTYTATTAPISDEPAVILSPDPGTQFGSTTVDFTWNDVGADIYALWIGTSYGQNDIYAEWLTGVSTTVTGLPNDGSTIHVRMLSKFDGVWKSNFYTYTATTAPISDEPAVILSPDPGTQFGSTTVDFTWNDVGADIYALWIGTSYGQNDIYAEWLTGVSTTVTGLPNDGSTIHVRMLSKFDGVWKSSFYTYTATTAPISDEPAVILSPDPGTQFVSTTVDFTWNDVGADIYALWIGTSYGQNDIYAEWLTGVSTTVTGLPNDGSTIHVRMLSKFDGVWKSNFYTYTATTAPISGKPASILSPDPGTQFVSTTVEFTWDDVGADMYALWIGTSYGQNDIYAEWLTGVSTTVTGLPNDGSTIHVRMLSKFDGEWKSKFYTYTATSGSL